MNPLTTYGLSEYPGEYRVVEKHPQNEGADWYSKAEVDAFVEKIAKTLEQTVKAIIVIRGTKPDGCECEACEEVAAAEVAGLMMLSQLPPKKE